ncbi:MAG: DUF924 domain-containing protein [Rhodospirillaceae bacterium]|jgi:uncharacterized protein (DUF924 family)|nr:DUF924 domain-containing protein [Rhodospirillaceae bacterium]MBT4672729.1 DUF924 domain-containing protein [Rhodospirillaceae bacterium]MBT5840162.1 DUF924 domain-containing protein [Rhodospirillaceae bacterium]MBT6859849.1 DUF924 domain-containing protein [Rhodospirillaceae bacterium]MBT7029379.1 DUF924 domain-containing protein [Rhodospirillaceae bacterium]
MTEYNDILNFWFETTDLGAELELNEAWFRSTDAFDAEIREKFQSTWRAAGTGALDHWMDAPDSCLALIVLLDQFPRNMYRGQGRAYASDFRARVAAKRLLAKGWDTDFGKRFRTFAYLPFEHSESVTDQERAVELMNSQGEERGMKAAQEHLDAIKRFGRFPHRNAPMGRTSTAAELDYLKDPPRWGKSAIKNADPDE